MRRSTIPPAPAADASRATDPYLVALHESALDLMNRRDVAGVVGAILRRAATLADTEHGCVYLVEDDESASPDVAIGVFTRLNQSRVNKGVGMAGRTWAAGSPTVVDEYDEFADRDPEFPTGVLHACLGIPLTGSDGSVIGLMGLGHTDPDRRFGPLDVERMTALGQLAAVALENAGLYEAERREERALKDAESQFRDLVEHVPLVTYRDALDDVTALYVSPQIESLIGYSPDEWIGDNSVWRRALHPDDRDAALAENQRTGRTGDPFVMNYRMIARDGRVVWVHDESRLVYDDAGEPRFWQGIMVDVTERTLAQQALEDAEAKYRSLVERLPAVTYTVGDPRRPDDPAEGPVEDEYVSPQIKELIGCTPEEWLQDQTAWRRYVHPDDRAMVIDRWHRDSAAGDTFDLEYRMVAADGRIVWVHDQAALVRERSGRPHLWQGIIIDVTERRGAEEALKEAFEHEREVSERLRALDDMKNTFLAAVSHELRTPLSAILGVALTLERDDLELPPEDSRDLLRRLAANARKLDRLLSDLLDLDRLIRGIVEPRRRPTDVASLVRQVVDGADAARGRPVELDLEPVTLNVDPAQVERIVENLVTNAARYSTEDSLITVRVKDVPDGVTIIVDDEGPGIPANLREAVFEPFRQVPGRNPHAPGVGIGLSLVSRFAQLHGGVAWVQVRENGGSSFRVLLRDGTG
jgi:PAS domain S-box-containing protein